MTVTADLTLALMKQLRDEQRDQRNLLVALTNRSQLIVRRLDQVDGRLNDLMARFPDLEDSLGQTVRFELLGALANRESKQEKALDAIEAMFERIDQDLADVRGREAQSANDAASMRTILDGLNAALGVVRERVNKLEGESG